MDQFEIERLIKNIDERTSRIEQILPTLATKDDLRGFATNDYVREEGERTRLHFDVVAEAMKAEIKRIAEGHAVVDARVDGVRAELKEDLSVHDKRITKLEAGASKRR